MIGIAKALYSFFSGFGLPAFVVGAVPDDAELPYITYELVATDWDDVSEITATIWDKSTGLKGCAEIADNIAADVYGGKIIQIEKGYVVLHKGSPFMQLVNLNDNTMKAVELRFMLSTMII